MVQIVEELVHHAIGVPFNGLDAFVVVPNGLAVGFGAQFADHFGEHGDALFEEGDLVVHGFDVGTGRAEENTFADFLDGFRDAVECPGEGFDVFALQRGDEVGAEGFRDFLRDALVLASALVQVPERVLHILRARHGSADDFAKELD